MLLPSRNTRSYWVGQVQVPSLRIRQVFSKSSPAGWLVLSGTFTSRTLAMRLVQAGVGLAVGVRLAGGVGVLLGSGENSGGAVGSWGLPAAAWGRCTARGSAGGAGR